MGTGKHRVIVFHGFGQTLETFTPLANELVSHCTCYLFNIFFHGESTWDKGETPLEKEYWKKMLTAFFEKEGIDHFDLIGYSLGGKFALATAEAFPEKVGNLFLLAPDGIKTNPWYSLATYPVFIRHFFKSMVLKPTRFYKMVNIAFRAGLIDKSLQNFVVFHMDTQEKRQRVYLSWVVFRHFKFDVPSIASIFNKHSINLVVILGRFDRIITEKNISARLAPFKHFRLEVIETGHRGIVDQSKQLISSFYKN